jgi:hypothetical protein
MNVALPWLLLVGRKPIIATRGVNPFFMLQLRCATFRFALPRITHAPTRTDAAEQVHWDGAKDEDTVLPIMGEGPAACPVNRKRFRCMTASTITTCGAEGTLGLRGAGARLASCQPGLAAQPSQVFNLKFRLTLMRFICRWAPHFHGPVVRVTEFYPLYPTNSDTTAAMSRRSTGASFRRLMLLLVN